MMNQTILTDDFVLIEDGPLTDELELVVKEFEEAYPRIFNVVRLERNLGLGLALAE